MEPTETPTIRSGVTSSTWAPERPSCSVASRAGSPPWSSKTSTRSPGRGAPPVPPMTSQVSSTRFCPTDKNERSGIPPVATTTTSGSSASTVVGLGEDAVPEVDAAVLRLGHPPVDDADQVAAAGAGRGEQHLPAGPVGRLHEHDVVAALAEHPGRLEPGGAGADDDGALAPSRRWGRRRGAATARARWRGCGCTWRRRTRRSRPGSTTPPRTAGSGPPRRGRPWPPGGGRPAAAGSSRPGRAGRRGSRGGRWRRRRCGRRA